jgi:hypothetical protein
VKLAHSGDPLPIGSVANPMTAPTPAPING